MPYGGFLVNTADEWIDRLQTLLNDAAQRQSLGESGRAFIENNFSISSNTNNFLSLFDN